MLLSDWGVTAIERWKGDVQKGHCSNEVGERGEGEAGGVGARNRRVSRSRGETDGAQQMALLEANLSRVSFEAEYILQPDPKQGCIARRERRYSKEQGY